MKKGLYMAGLNFPGNAHYETDIPDDFYAVTPWELIPWILGTWGGGGGGEAEGGGRGRGGGTLTQARERLSRFRPLAIPFSDRILERFRWLLCTGIWLTSPAP